MPFDGLRTLLVALMSQPIVVAALVLLFGIHAAIWQRILERVGLPPSLASLLLVPPLTLLLPLYVAVAHWPGQRVTRFPVRRRNVGACRTRRQVQAHKSPRTFLGRFNNHRPLLLDANGLPRFRIPLPQPQPIPYAPDPLEDALRRVESRYRN